MVTTGTSLERSSLQEGKEKETKEADCSQRPMPNHCLEATVHSEIRDAQQILVSKHTAEKHSEN
jgi:hypothetical protein